MVEREGLGESDLICSLPLGNTVENGIQCLVFIQEYDRRHVVDGLPRDHYLSISIFEFIILDELYLVKYDLTN